MKTGFACGIFDLLHPGHVLMLKECRDNCDFLIVALNKAEQLSADKHKPVLNIEERRMMMESCRYADQVLIYGSEEELLQILTTHKIDIRFLGEDYKTKPITGKELPIPLYFISRGHGYSTTALVQRIKNS